METDMGSTYGDNAAIAGALRAQYRIEALEAEVERLLSRIRTLQIYETFGQDHDHEACVRRISELEDQLQPHD
jgi:hypothetical protein